MENQRNIHVDCLKAFLAFFVIYGHIMIPLFSNYFDVKMVLFILSFHMPAFMFLTGYTYYYSRNNSIKKLLITRSICLAIPIIVWGSVYYIYFHIFLQRDKINFINWLFAITEEGLWFLFAVLFLQWGMVFVTRVLKKKQFLCWIIIYIVVLVLCEFIRPMRMIAYMYPFYGCGYFVHYVFENQKNLKVFLSKVIIILAALFPILILGMSSRDTIYNSGMAILNSEYGFYQIIINIYRYLIGFSGCSLLYIIGLSLIDLLSDNVKNNIADIGKVSLELYCLNYFIAYILLGKLLSYFSQSIENEWITAVCIGGPFATLSLICAYILLTILKKFHLLYFFLFGRIEKKRIE